MIEQTVESASAALAEMGYVGVTERVFTSSHPEVIRWTQIFNERLQERQIFERFTAAHKERSKEKAIVVATQWHRFSEFMPWFLCRAASMVSTNRKRHHVIQTAFEELGMRDEEEIHPDMFFRAVEQAGVTTADRQRLSDQNGVNAALLFLRGGLLSRRSDEEIMGMLLGLEIPARENVETVFEALVHMDGVREALAETPFFRLHRCIEIEHIRLTVANFLRFCQRPEEQARFVEGFDLGLDFWAQFWSDIGEMIKHERGKLS